MAEDGGIAREGAEARRGLRKKKLTPCLRVLAGKTAFGSPEGEMSGSERVKL